MKKTVGLVVSLLLLTVPAAGQYRVARQSEGRNRAGDGSPNANSQQENRPFITSEVPILSVSEQEAGTNGDMANYRYFRLYRGSRVALSDLKEDEHSHQLKSIYRNFTINDDDLNEIMGLLEAPDFLEAEGVPALSNGFDPMVFLIIEYGHPKHPRTIRIADYKPKNLEIKGYYPDSVARLMTKIESLRKTAQ